MKLIIVTLTVSLVVSLYFFTIYQTKKSLETEKPPKRNKTPKSERSHEKKRLSEGTKSPESKRLPDAVIIGVKKSGTMTLGRRERRPEVNDLTRPLSPRQVPQSSPEHCGGR